MPVKRNTKVKKPASNATKNRSAQEIARRNRLAEVTKMVHNVAKSTDPHKHPDFKKLNYAKLKAQGFGVKKLAENFHLEVRDLYKLGAPTKTLLNHFGLDAVLEHVEFANALHGIIPMSDLRKCGVPAKVMLKEIKSPGALHKYGKYTKKELLQAGVPRQTIANILKFDLQSSRNHRKRLRK